MSFKVRQEKSEQNLEIFKQTNQRAWEMLEELKTRCPWRKGIVNSLVGYVEFKGQLTAKQLSLITDMYLDNCAMSDGDITEQVDCRKLCFKLMNTSLGKMGKFIQSVLNQTGTRPFTQAQIRGVRKIANWKKEELSKINIDSTFDGWNIKLVSLGK